MTRTHSRIAIGWRQCPPGQTPRLRLNPKALPTGFVDGGWWPRSTDLAAELPDLLAVLSVRLGAIRDVTCRLGEWDRATATMRVGEHTVRISGFRRQPLGAIEIRGLNGTSIVSLVVSPSADPDQAYDTLMAAATPDDAPTTERLLRAGSA